MKTLYCKSRLLLVVLLAAGLNLGAQTLREEDSRDFNTTSSTELSISNQFGNITITDWDQNKVSIIYIVEVTNSDESKAKKMMEKIKVNFKEDGNRIIVETKIGNEGNLNLHSEKGEKQSFKIDYTVKCPKSIKLSLDNQFGDMIISSLTGPFKGDLQFGSFSAVSLTGPENKLDLQFGKATIGTLTDAKIDIQHSDGLKITDAGNLTIDAQFTQIDIGTVVSLKADLNSSTVTIENLSELLKADMNMGNLKIGKVAAGFKSITIDQNMGDLTLDVDPKAGYTLTAEVNMGSIKVPDGLKLEKQKESDLPGITLEKVTGTFGNGNSVIKIESNMGSVKIR